nr:MAG TPA: hypothetical protein [Caudoviricetes sp.]
MRLHIRQKKTGSQRGQKKRKTLDTFPVLFHFLIHHFISFPSSPSQHLHSHPSSHPHSHSSLCHHLLLTAQASPRPV